MARYYRNNGMLVHLTVSFAVMVSLLAGSAWSQESIRLKTKGPEELACLRYASQGVFFVDKTLKEEYDRLLYRVHTLKLGLDEGRINNAALLAESKEELKDLQTKLDRLQKEIEKRKVFVSLGKVHKQTETVTFNPGPERLLVVTAENLHVVGWDGPQVKCVLKKEIIVPDKDESTKVDEQLRGIRLVHKHDVAPRTVGKTPAERDADVRKELASRWGSKLTEKEKAIYRLVKTKEGDRYRAFQGKKVDTIAIEGLRPDEGNRMIDMEISGKHYSCSVKRLQRHAALTVYVPHYKTIALQGGERGLIVKGIHGNLLLDGGRTGRPTHATFEIRDVYGSLTVFDLPTDSLALSAIHGNVQFLPSLTWGFTWSSPGTADGVGLGGKGIGRLMTPRYMRVITCKGVEGDFTASFLNADLHLEGVAGRMDVQNDFGNTTMTADTVLAKKKHRFVSESGRIEIHLTPEELDALPIRALSIVGTVQTDAPWSAVQYTGDAIWPAPDGTTCNWRGMMSHFVDIKGGNYCKTMRAIVNGEDNTPGITLLCRSGVIRIFYEPQDKLKTEEIEKAKTGT